MTDADDLDIARPSPFPVATEEPRRQRSEKFVTPSALRLALMIEDSPALGVIMQNIARTMPGVLDKETVAQVSSTIQFLDQDYAQPEILGNFQIRLALRDRNNVIRPLDARDYDG